jgi:transposase-like protein
VQYPIPACEKPWQRYARPVGTSWRVEETYIKIQGKWGSFYRALDKEGHTVDFLLNVRRDREAAKRFFAQAVAKRGILQKFTLDGYAASQKASATLQREGTLPAALRVRPNRSLHNVIAQDHRRVKQRV